MVLIQFLRLPPSNLLLRTLVDLGHVPAFAIIAYLTLEILRLCAVGRPATPHSLHFAIAAAVTILLAVASEAMQLNIPGRSTSVLDVLRNCAGGTFALLFAAHRAGIASANPRTVSPRLIAAIAALIVTFLLLPLAYTSAAYFHRSTNWPGVVGQNYFLERAFVDAYRSTIETVLVPGARRNGDSEKAYRMIFSQRGSSGVVVNELLAQWQQISQVCTEISNLGAGKFRARIRLGDHPNYSQAKHFTDNVIGVEGMSLATSCIDLQPTVHLRSLAVIVAPNNDAQEVLLRRIWFQ